MLPGIKSGILGAIGGKTLAVIGTAADSGASSSTLALPTHQAGDLLIALIRQSGGSTDNNMSGWVKERTGGNTGVAVRHYVFSRLADGTETTIPSIGSSCRRMVWALRGSSPITAVTVDDFASGGTPTDWTNDGDPSQQVKNSNVGPLPFAVFAGYGNDNGAAIDPRTFTISGAEASDSEISGGANWLYSKIKVFSAGAGLQQVTVDMADEGLDNVLYSFVVRPTMN